MAIMVLHTGGPKEDLWLDNDNMKYDGALFSALNINMGLTTPGLKT